MITDAVFPLGDPLEVSPGTTGAPPLDQLPQRHRTESQAPNRLVSEAAP